MTEREREEISNQGKRLRYMTTLFGDITFYKRLYQERGGRYRYLLDEKLGLTKNQRVSQAYQKIAGLLAFVSGSYRKAEGLIQEFYGDSPSFESIRRPADQIELKLDIKEIVSLDFDKDSNHKYDNTYSLPVLSGPHQDRPWARSLKRLVSID
jgi:hypothetical protein